MTTAPVKPLFSGCLALFLLSNALVHAGEARGAGARAGRYDPLPMRFEEMDRYDQIAMEPYRDRYDDMSIAEKADLYGRQFEAMRNRKPNFDPAISELVDSYRETREATSAYDAKRFMYKPATPKRPSPAGRSAAAAPGRGGNPLASLSGPWERSPQPEPEPEPEARTGQPTGAYPKDALRMENLRQGWNAADVLRGSRQR